MVSSFFPVYKSIWIKRWSLAVFPSREAYHQQRSNLASALAPTAGFMLSPFTNMSARSYLLQKICQPPGFFIIGLQVPLTGRFWERTEADLVPGNCWRMTNVTFQAEIILELTLIMNGDETVFEELSMVGLLGKFAATPLDEGVKVTTRRIGMSSFHGLASACSSWGKIHFFNCMNIFFEWIICDFFEWIHSLNE